MNSNHIDPNARPEIRSAQLPTISLGDDVREIEHNGRKYVVMPKETYTALKEQNTALTEQNQILKDLVVRLTEANRQQSQRIEILEATIARMNTRQDQLSNQVDELKSTVTTLKWVTGASVAVGAVATGVGAFAVFGPGAAAAAGAVVAA